MEHRTNKLPPTRRIREMSKGERRRQSVYPTNLPESFSLEFILAERCARHQEEPWVRVIGQRQPETNPITIKPETVSHMAEQFSWVPLPCRSPPGRPLPIKFLALSARVSPQTIHFWVLDKSLLLGPGRGLPSYNTYIVCKRKKERQRKKNSVQQQRVCNL